MEAAVLERKVKQLPFEAHRDVSDYLDFLLHKYRIEKKEVTFTDFGTNNNRKQILNYKGKNIWEGNLDEMRLTR